MSAPTPGNSAHGSAGGNNDSCATGTFNVTTGRSVLVACIVDTIDVTSVTDSQSNTYTKIGSTYNGDGAAQQSFWLAQNVTGNASLTVTQNHVGGAYPRIIALEVTTGLTSGAYVSAYAPAGNQDSSSPFTTSAAATALSDLLIVGQFSNRVDAGTFSSSSPSVLQNADADNDFAVATNVAAAAGSWSV